MANDYVDDWDQPAPSRREFIRRGAIMLGVAAWAAPVVQIARQHGQGAGGDGSAAPEMIGVQQVTAECTTCADTVCGEFTLCGTSGILDCVCVPSASTYPIAGCVCGVAGFCDELQPPGPEGCPPGYGLAQGCCPQPVCLPPCPVNGAAARTAAAGSAAAPGTGRKTFNGKSV